MFVAKGMYKTNINSTSNISTLAGSGYKLPLQRIEVKDSFTGVITIPNHNNHALIDLDVGNNNVSGNGVEPIVYENTNGRNLRILGEGKISAGTITDSEFDDVVSNLFVPRTNSKVPYSDYDGKDYTLPQTTPSGANGLSTFVTTTTGSTVGLGFSGDSNGAGTGTYTVPRTGRVYFVVVAGGAGGGEWYGRGPGGGGGGGVNGYFDSLTAGTVIQVAFGGHGGGVGSNSRSGHGGPSVLSIAGTELVRARGGLGKPSYSGTGGVGGTVTVNTSNPTYPITVNVSRNGTNGIPGPGGGGQGWFTQDGAATYIWRNNHAGNNPGSRWTSGNHRGWGDGGGGGPANRGGNSGAPGIVFLWQDGYSSTDSGDPYYPGIACFTGAGVTVDNSGNPITGVTLSNFLGEYTRAALQ